MLLRCALQVQRPWAEQESALPFGKTHCVPRAAFDSGLYGDHRHRESALDSISLHKGISMSFLSQGYLADPCSSIVQDLSCEVLILGRIDLIQGRRENSNRFCSCV